jgi:YHS domain-containing protein/thiol-disulfide isomerase/thioredoxin
MRKIGLWAMVYVMAVLWWGTPVRAQNPQSIWFEDLNAARRVAAETNRLVLIHFWAEWCRPCRQMEAEVFSRPEVLSAIATSYVAVKVNFDQNPVLARQLNVESIPTDVIITPQGEIIAKSVGGVSAPRYVERLNEVASQWQQRQALVARMAGPPPGSFGPSNQLNGPDATLPVRPPIAGPAPAWSPAARVTAPGMPESVGPQPGAENRMPLAPGYNPTLAAQAPSNFTQQPPMVANPSPQVAPPAPSPTIDTSQAWMTQNSSGPGSPWPASTPVGEMNAPALNGGSVNPYLPSNTPYSPTTGAPSYAAQSPVPTAPGALAPSEALRPNSPALNSFAGSNGGPGSTAPPSANPPAATPETFLAARPSSGNEGRQTDIGSTGSPSSPVAIPPGNPPLALDGYCPVSLTDKHRWVLGNRRWGARHEGRTYLFAGPEEQQKFLANPDRYAPVLSGYDVVKLVEGTQLVEGRREHGAWFGGRVYLFSDEESFQKFSADPYRYINALPQAVARLSQKAGTAPAGNSFLPSAAPGSFGQSPLSFGNQLAPATESPQTENRQGIAPAVGSTSNTGPAPGASLPPSQVSPNSYSQIPGAGLPAATSAQPGPQIQVGLPDRVMNNLPSRVVGPTTQPYPPIATRPTTESQTPGFGAPHYGMPGRY